MNSSPSIFPPSSSTWPPPQALAPTVPSAWHTIYPVFYGWLLWIIQGLAVWTHFLLLHLAFTFFWRFINAEFWFTCLLCSCQWNIGSRKCHKKLVPVLSREIFPEPARGSGRAITEARTFTEVLLWFTLSLYTWVTQQLNMCVCSLYREETETTVFSNLSWVNLNTDSFDSKTFALNHWRHCLFL